MACRNAAREVQRLKDELAEERGKIRLPPAVVIVIVPADDAATASCYSKDGGCDSIFCTS